MITLSVDPHPGSHTAVALDPNGARLASITIPNTPDGLCQLHQFAIPFASRRWAIEGAGNHFIAVFVGQLLERSEIVYSIPPSLTSQYRSRRGRKKNDVVDAENVGRALLANSRLTPLHNTEQQRELQELTRAQRRLSEQLSANRVALQELLAESAVRDIMEQVIAVLVKQLAALEKQIRAAIHAVMPSLLPLPGVGPIVAGVLLAWPKQEIPSALPVRTILRVTVGQRQWKEAAGKIVACRSILPAIVVSTGLFILWPWSGSEWMGVDRRGSWSERSFVERRSDLACGF